MRCRFSVLRLVLRRERRRLARFGGHLGDHIRAVGGCRCPFECGVPRRTIGSDRGREAKAETEGRRKADEAQVVLVLP